MSKDIVWALIARDRSYTEKYAIQDVFINL